MRIAAATAVAIASVGCALAPAGHEDGNTSTARSAVVGATTSPVDDDFALFLAHLDDGNFACTASLVAPNLVVTAKHCVFEYEPGDSVCAGNGNPAPGGNGGFVKGPIPLDNIGFYKRGDGKKRFKQAEPADAVATAVVHDGTIKLCSYDFAYVVLDRPLADVPIARLRLGRRPTAGATVAVAGWGTTDDRINPTVRLRRTDISIRRVGEPIPDPASTGTLGPRTFETGPGACAGDSGSPAFDLASGTVLGVVTRGLALDATDPISPCAPSSVSIVHTVVADFPNELRAAFAAAKAEPWIEGHAAAGYQRFDDPCSADLECATGACVGATSQTPGRCNVYCTKPDATCPSGLRCGAAGICEASAPIPASSAPPPEAPALEPPPPTTAIASCSSAASGSAPDGRGAVIAVVSLCLAVARRRRFVT